MQFIHKKDSSQKRRGPKSPLGNMVREVRKFMETQIQYLVAVLKKEYISISPTIRKNIWKTM